MAKDALLSSHPDMHLFKVQNLKSPELRGAAPAQAEAAEKRAAGRRGKSRPREASGRGSSERARKPRPGKTE